MRTLDDLVRAGKIRYIGFSNTPAWVTAQAQTMALLKGWTPLIALQVEYSLLARTVEGELAPFALRSGHLAGCVEPAEERLPVRASTGATPRSPTPLAPLSSAAPPMTSTTVIDAVASVADSFRTISAAVSLAWLRARQGSVVPIVGARRLEHLESNLAALDVTLRAEQVRTLDEVSAPPAPTRDPMHGAQRAMLQFAGTTVDGEHRPCTRLHCCQSDVRY